MARPKGRTRKIRKPLVTEKQWAALNDKPYKPGFDTLGFEYGDDLKPLWEQYGDGITKTWIKEHPGTRPSCWWRFIAPRMIDFAPPEPAQLKYLKRFGLLTERERELLKTDQQRL